MIYSALVLLLTSCLTSSLAFIVISPGNCPDVAVQQGFDLNQYLGTWYSYEDFAVPYQFLTNCVTAQYSLRSDGNIRVVNSGYRQFQLFGQTLWRTPVRAEGMASIVDPSEPAGLKVQFGGQPDMGDQANYLIVSTDYTTYSLVYSCTPLIAGFPLRVEAAWILTRERGRRPNNLNQIKYMLRQYGINVRNFERVDHTNC